jgi:hypothetical protein
VTLVTQNADGSAQAADVPAKEASAVVAEEAAKKTDEAGPPKPPDNTIPDGKYEVFTDPSGHEYRISATCGGLAFDSVVGYKRYLKARKYLMQDPDAQKVILALEGPKDGNMVLIMEKTGDEPTIAYNRINESDKVFGIDWNVTLGMEFPVVGPVVGRLSPAMCLLHELAHAERSFRDFQGQKDDLQPDFMESIFPKWKNAEEKRVILGVERSAATTLHEGVKNDHNRGVWIRVSGGVTSNTPRR